MGYVSLQEGNGTRTKLCRDLQEVACFIVKSGEPFTIELLLVHPILAKKKKQLP